MKILYKYKYKLEGQQQVQDPTRLTYKLHQIHQRSRFVDEFFKSHYRINTGHIIMQAIPVINHPLSKKSLPQ